MHLNMTMRACLLLLMLGGAIAVLAYALGSKNWFMAVIATLAAAVVVQIVTREEWFVAKLGDRRFLPAGIVALLGRRSKAQVIASSMLVLAALALVRIALAGFPVLFVALPALAIAAIWLTIVIRQEGWSR